MIAPLTWCLSICDIAAASNFFSHMSISHLAWRKLETLACPQWRGLRGRGRESAEGKSASPSLAPWEVKKCEFYQSISSSAHPFSGRHHRDKPMPPHTWSSAAVRAVCLALIHTPPVPAGLVSAAGIGSVPDARLGKLLFGRARSRKLRTTLENREWCTVENNEAQKYHNGEQKPKIIFALCRIWSEGGAPPLSRIQDDPNFRFRPAQSTAQAIFSSKQKSLLIRAFAEMRK